MFDFRPIELRDSSLSTYAELFRACFPNATHLDERYLGWLYAENPDGKVVGFDAYAGDRLAAHYACIPVEIEVFGKIGKGLLSLNTATHPDFQGKGLFTQLASRTYDHGAAQGFSAVYGVANANSTPGFIKKLGFTLVSPLEARVGLGPSATIDWDRGKQLAQFRRVWDDERILWRCRNPANHASVVTVKGNELHIKAATDKPMIAAWASVPGNFNQPNTATRVAAPGSLFLGLLPAGAHRFRFTFNIPQRFRPSPLNFIFKSLTGSTNAPEAGSVACSFIDFDAY